MSFDQNGRPNTGDLGTDRPHTFEFQGAYQFPWKTTVGAYYLIGSGLPQTSTITVSGVPVMYKGRGDLGRTPTFSQTDLNLVQEVSFFGRTRFTRRTSSTCSTRRP